MPRQKKLKTKTIKKQETKLKSIEKPMFYQSVGRRKEATARVRLYIVANSPITVGDNQLKAGDIIVNNTQIDKYFAGEVYRKFYLEPFRTTNTISRYAVSSLIEGGGKSGQIIAFIHGVARALEQVDREKFRPILKKRGFLTRDARVKERRKAGFAQKARAKKQSPKR